MGFDASVISNERLIVQGADVVLSWDSSAPDGTVHQVYLDERLVWSGTGFTAVLPMPPVRATLAVGAVGSGEAETSFGGTNGFGAGAFGAGAFGGLGGWNDRARLSWTATSYAEADRGGFRVYGEDSPGGGIDYGTPLATIPWGSADGFGAGGFGSGGFGSVEQLYGWTSDPLSGGTWEFAVVPLDLAGNEGTPDTVSVSIAAPPRAPAPDSLGRRLWVSAYDSGTGVATLSWNASPDA